MNHHPRHFDIERLSADEVRPSERARLDAHLEQCERCYAYLQELERERETLLAEHPVEEFLAQVAARGAASGSPAAVAEQGLAARLRGLVVAEADGGATGFVSRPALAMGALALVVVVVGFIGIMTNRGAGSDEGRTAAITEAAGETGTTATIALISRAADDELSGVELRPAGSDDFAPAAVDSAIAAGTTVRTDGRTRVRLTLSEGTTLVLNHATELTLDGVTPRHMRLDGGELLADVAHLADGPRAAFVTPTGRVDVLGTKFVLTATDDLSSVRVVRGHVRIHGGDSARAEVKAGEEGLIESDGNLSVTPAVDLAGSVRWSELEPISSGDGENPSTSGIGQLRAKVPGEREARERPLSLASHSVRVRIVGNVARTEIEEVFRNDSGVVLEGIYKFPMPPDAQIARLALDVEGGMEEAAFVERGVASKIWRGVIRAATKRPRRLAQSEYIWVPGPWRDPALLEWQRGGNVELRVFPIPAHGERRVIIAYTQNVRPHGKNRRRYVYPMAHSADGSTRIGRFEADVRVAGADPAAQIRTPAYAMASADAGGATRLTMTQNRFMPAGDLIVDYALPDGDSELRWWTYQGAAAGALPEQTAGGGRKSRTSSEVREALSRLAADTRPFAVFALRPELPARLESHPRDYVLVVDSSQSMVGERYARARSLVTGLIGEMDRRDRFALLACDATCQVMDTDPRRPTSRAANEARSWLRNIRPAGASDLTAALRTAATALDDQRSPDRDVRVLYVGDGVSTAGHRRAGAIAAQVAALAASADVSFTTVGIGGDSDTMVLSAVARSGGGHFLPFVPGQRAGEAALAVLETTYGVSLRDATLELPEGVTQIAPAVLPTLRAGEELIVAARFSDEVRGEAVLRGTVSGEPYEDSYPVHLRLSTSAGNAFVPRLWAAATIERLELEGGSRSRSIALSRAFGVMSRDTSLLVLESEAMFRAFGVDRVRRAPAWTGDGTGMDGHESTGTARHGKTRIMENPYGGGDRAWGDDDGDLPEGRELAAGFFQRYSKRGFDDNERGGTLQVRTAPDATVALDGDGRGERRASSDPFNERRIRGRVARGRAQAASASGALDRSQVNRSVQRSVPRIRAVYERSLRSNPRLSGRVVVEFTIGPSGRVTSARVAESTLGDPAVGVGIVRVFHAMTFPAPQGGSVTVRYPFIFRTTGDVPAPDRPQARKMGPAAGNLDLRGRGPGRWMRKVWYRVGSIVGSAPARERDRRAVEQAESALRDSADSRDRHRDLVRALARAGDLERTLEVVEQWTARDQLDSTALIFLSDTLARQGRRDEAVRLLSGVVDLEPDNRALQERLAAAFDRSEQPARACSHRVSIAELALDDADALGAALRCTRALGRSESATQLLDAVEDREIRTRAEAVAAATPDGRVPRGELMIEAEWDGDEEIDISIITPRGRRLSWMGGRPTVVGGSATAAGRERLGLRRATLGSYIIEVSRVSPAPAGASADPANEPPITGRLRVRVLNQRRNIPFTLDGRRAAVGRINVRRESRLVPGL